MKNLLILVFSFTLLSSCKNKGFCECYFLRSELIEEYRQASSEVEIKEIEKRMNEFDVSCEDFQEYTSSITDYEGVDEYDEKVRECEVN